MLPTAHTRDGLALHLREWSVAEPLGTVLVVHGLGEHIGRYAHVAAALNAAGWRVVGYDQRGHGASEGARGVIRHGDDPCTDLAQVIDAVRDDVPGPLLLLGHSLGGLVVARFVAEGLVRAALRASWAREVDGLVLSSPALDPGLNGLQKLLLAVMGGLAPELGVNNGLKPAWISRDAQVVAAYQADPLVHDRVAARLVRFIVDGGAFVREQASRWTVPTLLMWAGSDRCVAPAGSAAFAEAAPTGVVTARLFAPLFHEIFNEPEQREVFAVLGQWLARRATWERPTLHD